MTSPCSVTLKRPLRARGGCASIASRPSPAPRPPQPPRPGKKRNATPPQGRDRGQRPDRIGRLRRERDRGRYERPRRTELARKPRGERRFIARRERRHIRLDDADDFVERVPDAIAVLTPFELAQVKAEDLDGAAQTLQRPRDIVSAVRPHAALEHLEIGEKRPCS